MTIFMPLLGINYWQNSKVELPIRNHMSYFNCNMRPKVCSDSHPQILRQYLRCSLLTTGMHHIMSSHVWRQNHDEHKSSSKVCQKKKKHIILGDMFINQWYMTVLLVRHMVEAVCCHDAQDISGTQIVLLWKCEVPPVTCCDTQTLWSSYKF
jgi:hypothetical protein